MVNYRLCIIHTLTEDFVLLTFKENESLIQNKRVQFQVNFISNKSLTIPKML